MPDRGDVLDTPPETSARIAMERSHLYGFLARVFGGEVSSGFLTELRDTEFRRHLAETGAEFGEAFFDRPQDELLEELATEYALLFLGPGKHISPHESVHAGDGDGSLLGEATTLVKQFIEYSGYEYQPGYSGLPDHISVELDFMKELSAQESAAWQKDDFKAAGNCVSFENEFLSKHLAKWVPAFGRKVIEGATMPFYCEMAKLLVGFIEGEVDDRRRGFTHH